MNWINTIRKIDTDSLEILQSTSRHIIFTVGGLYLVWHFIATLVWPQVYTPHLWLTTFFVMIVLALSARLLKRHYPLAQAVWMIGLTIIILHAYGQFHQPAITLFLTFLPLMAIVTIGVPWTFVVELLIIGLVISMPLMTFLPPLPSGYGIGIVLCSIFTGFFGWAISSNLLSAISSSSYHYREARRLLEETRIHRAEISRMLKEQNQANYQLERLNQMLQWSRRHAEEARADRDRFILAVSHELRSPLNFIIGFSDLMVNTPEMYAEKTAWPAGLYEDIQEIYRSSTHLLRLINDILDLGQINAQQMTIFREWIGLQALTEEVRQMVEPSFAQKGLQLNIVAPPELPNVFADSTRIRQVMLNLLNNSLRFTTQGSVTIHISRAQDMLQVCVEDSGPGIAPEDGAKVFDEFRQVGQESWRRREGSGLGLAISRRFIQLHGGIMWLESTPGVGSRFYFTIPILQTASPKAEPSQQAQSTPAAYYPAQESRPTCLLLSTNPHAEQAIQQYLDDYQIFSLDQTNLLSERVSQLQPRAILVDKSSLDEQRLPLQDLPYDVPVLAFYIPGVWDRFETLPSGVADYLVKPIARQTLVNAVHQLNIEIHTLLVVDDDPAMQRFVTQALRASQDPGTTPIEQIYSASSGEEAIRLLHEKPVDLIMLDIDLPDMNGWRILAALQRIPSLASIPVMIISATDLPHIFFAVGRTVLNVSMKRSLSPQELSTALRTLLENVEPGLSKAEDPTVAEPPTDPAV